MNRPCRGTYSPGDKRQGWKLNEPQETWIAEMKCKVESRSCADEDMASGKPRHAIHNMAALLSNGAFAVSTAGVEAVTDVAVGGGCSIPLPPLQLDSHSTDPRGSPTPRPRFTAMGTAVSHHWHNPQSPSMAFYL